jgi:hypothetical protein
MKVGDVVTWTHCSRRGKSSFCFSSRKGKVTHLTERNVTVQYRGKLIHLHPDKVRPEGQRLELTEMVMRGQV